MPEKTVLPDDLRLVVGWHQLFQLTLEAVVASAPANCARSRKTGVMLSLVTYCYAAKVLGSAEIEEAASDCRDIAYIIRGRTITASDVRQFRRAYRQVIAICLERVFLAVAQASLARESVDTDSLEWDRKAKEYAKGRLDLAILVDAAMAD